VTLVQTSAGSAPVAAPADPLAGMKPLISVTEAAAVLGFSRTVAYRRTKDGSIPTRRIGGRVYVLTSGLRDLLAPDAWLNDQHYRNTRATVTTSEDGAR
jgi:excisionase family DNA binding protein